MTDYVKPSHKAVKAYYKELQQYADLGATHELAVRSAFQNLLATTAKRARHWALVPEQGIKVNGRTIFPDGTLYNQWNLPYGYWEAKDTDDDIDAAIHDKRKKSYPLTNIIFENTQTGVLYQHGDEVLRVDLTAPQQLADLLNLFYSYTEPQIEDFEHAVDEFQERISELAGGLKERIQEAHSKNKKFQAAFEKFYALCREALNPNLRRDAVDEMLIQHLLTERLMRTVFDMPQFAQRNVIAREVENVITALTSRSFNRKAFLGDLDRFYVAIEAAARQLHSFEQKQGFLDKIYESFFQGYSVKKADTHGIVYTPQPIVQFMINAVGEVLDREFGLRLGAEGVQILDPCTGTGNFIVNLMQHVHPRDLPRVYREQLFANEVMLLPYYIAALNVEHAYYDLTGEYVPFEGLCFVDTLDLVQGGHQLPMFAEANTVRVDREQKAPITVIIGNPPYNVGQLNENDNNKNRVYRSKDRSGVDDRVADTYSKDSGATNKNALSDAYVKFFRWAADRLGDRDGVVCFVSNNGFIDGQAFDGFRKHLLQDFTRVYHIDLHGNVRQNPKLSGTTHNVFGIQVGVGITIAVRSRAHTERCLYYHRVPEFWRREQKLNWLTDPTPDPVRRADPTPYPLPASREGKKDAPPLPAGDETASPPLLAGEAGRGSLLAGEAGRGSLLAGEAGRGSAKAYERHGGWPVTSEMWEKLKPLARELRREMTPAEKHLWQRLRRQQLGFKFRRQHSIERFIVDFYCSEARLIIEVDGSIHEEQREADAIRQDYLETQDYRVLRFENDAIFTALDGVLEVIAEALHDPLPASHAGDPLPTSPASRGGEGDASQFPSLLAGRGQGVGSVLRTIPWRELHPDDRHTWLIPTHADQFDGFMPIGSREAKTAGSLHAQTIFVTYGRGVQTARDAVVYDFDRAALIPRVQQFIEDYNGEVDRWRRAGAPGNIDDFVDYTRIKWSRDLKQDLQRHNYADYDETKVRESMYRPFCKKHLFFDRVLNEEVYVLPDIFPTPATEGVNQVICLTDKGSEKPFMALVAASIVDLHLVGAGSGTQCFPFYVYDPLPASPASRGGERRENITAWALQQFQTHYDDQKITKWDVFYYVYAVLHHPEYRERYADNLKRDLPRVPFVPDFWAFAHAGRKLAKWHLEYETAKPYKLDWVIDEDAPRDLRVEKMRFNKEQRTIKVNDWLTLSGVPAEVDRYRLGNRSAVEWIVDQYRVKTDKRSGITHDPNRSDDPEYIVNLIERVVRVSVETVQIVDKLAECALLPEETPP